MRAFKCLQFDKVIHTDVSSLSNALYIVSSDDKLMFIEPR